MTLKSSEKKENLVYLLLWALLFIAPVVAIYVHTQSVEPSEEFPWHDVMRVWRLNLVFFVVFVVHNFFIAPLLIYKHRKTLYVGAVALLLSAFVLWQCQSGPAQPLFSDPNAPYVHNEWKHEPPHEGRAADSAFMTSAEKDSMEPFREPPEAGRPPGEPPFGGPDGHGEVGPGDPHHHDSPPPMMQMERVFSIVVLFLMLGMNLGVKYFFKSEEDNKQMEELERKNLEQQLAYLKYQINPHFFMNTLNNIHALVDIDPAKAQETIVILSKIMRHVLYEGDRSLIPMKHEVDFLDNYVKLMRIRCADQVRIDMDVQRNLPDAGIPPLLLITFVENAFKHGISYEQDSFISVKLSVMEERLKFVCRNSKVKRDESLGGTGEKKSGGVGLTNVKKRLELIYGNSYTLDIEDGEAAYEVLLLLPLLKDEKKT